jgi:hypothetical protein
VFLSYSLNTFLCVSCVFSCLVNVKDLACRLANPFPSGEILNFGISHRHLVSQSRNISRLTTIFINLFNVIIDLALFGYKEAHLEPMLRPISSENFQNFRLRQEPLLLYEHGYHDNGVNTSDILSIRSP